MTTKSILDAPAKAFLLAIPFVSSLLVGWYLLGIDDAKEVLIWGAYLFLLTVAVLPLGSFIFKNSGSGGFIMTTALGIIAVSLFVWTFTYLKIYFFTRIFVFLAIFIIALICYLVKPLRDNLIETMRKPFYIEKVTSELTFFMLALTILCYFRGLDPLINGQEKFMDYGFIMSMLRNPNLPANDMWLAGYSINYYYFGQFIWALVIKLSGIAPEIGYNVAMTTTIALPFAMAYSIGVMLFDGMAEKTNYLKGFWPGLFRIITGVLTSFVVIIFGNSHSFFYDGESFGNKILVALHNLGINVGNTADFSYPDSTRFIGYNPDSKIVNELGEIIDEGDYTIEEFPFYSYLIGDLHAHVISMMIVLLIIGITIALITRTKFPDSYELDVVPKRISKKVKDIIFKTEYKRLITVELVAIAVLLGVAQQTNFWDFLFYFMFSTMALFVANTRSSKVFTDLSSLICFIANVAAILATYLMLGDKIYLHIIVQFLVLVLSYLLVCFEPTALTRTSFGMSFIFTVSFIISLPFNANFDMISNSLGKVTHNSSFFQLFILWGTHVGIALIFVVFTILYKNYKLLSPGELSKTKNNKTEIYDLPEGGFTNPVAKFFGERNLIDVFVCGMVVIGLMLISAPEIFYVRDIYTSGYLRANTMFKFAFGAFIIFGIVISYAVSRMVWITTSKNRNSVPALIIAIIAAIVILIVPGHYMFAGMKGRYGDVTNKNNYKGLDGISYLTTYYSQDSYIEIDGSLNSYLDAIRWLNENVEGSPVIAEAYGESYTDLNIVSAYTGLPTVVGWQTHEWLWRFKGVVDEESDLLVADPKYDVWDLYLTPRYNDLNVIYYSDDPYEIQSVIDKYNIEYIILGNLEYKLYDYDNTDTILCVGESVFVSENLNIFKVTPGKDVAVG